MGPRNNWVIICATIGLVFLIGLACNLSPTAPTGTVTPSVTNTVTRSLPSPTAKSTPSPTPSSIATITASPTLTPEAATPTAAATATPSATTTATQTATATTTQTTTEVPPTSPPDTPTFTPPPIPTIVYFRADVTEADPGDTITIEWETRDAEEVTIYHLMASGQLSLPYWEVEGSGQITYTISTGERNSTRFVLFATAAGETVQATLFVTLTCPDVWFFSPAPDICPASAALESAAAEEPFEQGTMIWVKEQDLIYVLFADGASPHWRAFQDRWSEGDPTHDPALEPPPGLYQPERGFGLIWREEPSVRDRLGWAFAPEASYVTKVQTTSRFKYNDLYVGALDGRVWMLKPEGSGWEIVSP